MRQQKNARADGYDARAALGRSAQRLCDLGPWRLLEVSPARHHDQVRLGQQFETAIDVHTHAAKRAQRRRVGRRNGEAVGHEIEFGPCEREEFGRNAEFEEREPVISERDDEGRRHGWILP